MPNERDKTMHSTTKIVLAAASIPLTAAPVAAETALTRVFLKDGAPSEIGGSASIIGTNAAEDITMRDQPGRVEFDASFNRGNDTIRLPGEARGYSVRQTGSQALLTHGNRSYSIPVGEIGISLVFSDGTHVLKFRTPENAMFIGDQRITEADARVASPLG